MRNQNGGWSCVALSMSIVVACGCSNSDADSESKDRDAQSDETSKSPRPKAMPPASPSGLSGPITGGKNKPFTASSADLSGNDYSEKEFFLDGSATAYKAQGGMTMDGKWTLEETTKATFKTRLLVRRPLDESEFNGTVVVEWLNVSGGADGDPGFMYNSDLILREGFAYVGVSAQAVGVEGGGFSLAAGPTALALKKSDPDRYGSLKHPGDAYSYDIFTQAGEALRNPEDVDPLEGLDVQRMIAYGESQSAMRMVSYVNGVHPLAKVYDGFFIHSRSAGGTPFEDAAGGVGGLSFGGFGGGTTIIRDDLDAKVFQFQTETDVAGMLAFLPARQPDSDKLRTWEVAGTAHADQYLVDFNASMVTEGAVQCNGANNGPQYRVIRAALASLNTWLSDGTEPPNGEVLQTNSSGMLVKDEHGNALGGVRSPDVDVPIRTLTGDPAPESSGSFWCFLFGSTTPFTPDTLMKLYPTHDDYVAKVKESATRQRKAGFLLEPEEKGFIEEAESAAVPE